MHVLVRRGSMRALLSSLVPHAGKESEDTPELGRVRFAPVQDALLGWATDHATAAAAAAEITQHVDGVLDSWDLSVQSCRQVLAVFQGPSNPDARMMWEDGDLSIELVGDEQVVLAEVGGIVPLRNRVLKVPRLVTAGTDTYPDVPSTLRGAVKAALPLTRPAPPASSVAVENLGKLVPSAKAWSTHVALSHTGEAGALLARCGARFLAIVPALPSGRDVDKVRVDVEESLNGWSSRLGPVQKPNPSRGIPAPGVYATAEALKDDLHAAGATSITHITPGGTKREVHLS